MFRRLPTPCLIACFALAASAGCSHSRISPNVALTGPWQKTFTFERMDTDKAPPDFTVTQTHGGAPASWLIKGDPHAASGGKVLAQVSTDATQDRFPLCIYNNVIARDVAVSVRFKAMTGKVDQAAGIVVRYLDKDDYYITRANALENNLRFYKVEKGKRIQLADATLEVTTRQWHALEIRAEGDRFQVYYDGQQVIQAKDSTFDEPGQVGLWTKADSMTYFDDLKIRQFTGRRGS